MPSPGDVLDFDGLDLISKGRVTHMLQFDRSAANWAENALRVTVGFQEHWGPAEYYALLPKGYKTQPNRACAFVSTWLILFKKKFDPKSDEVLRSINRPEYTLYRDGPYIVLSKGSERRWYFDSPDGGTSWHIARLELIQHPGLFVDFEYDGRLAKSLRFPNGQKALFEYKSSLLSQITTPFGEQVRIKRGAGGFIEQVDVYRLKKDPQGKPTYVLFARYQYKRDSEGRIKQFTAADGDVYNADYQYKQTQKDKTKREIYTTVVRRKRDGIFRARRDEVLKSGTWISERRLGGRGQTFEQASLRHGYRYKLRDHRWSTVSYKTGGSRGTNMSLDRIGNPVTTVQASGKVTKRQYNAMGEPLSISSAGKETRLQYNSLGQVTRRITPDGHETISHYDAHGRLLQKVTPDGKTALFTYDDRGFPASATVNGHDYQFTYDAWGRLTQMISSHGTTRYQYDLFGRLVTEIDGKWRTDYEYDAKGRLATARTPDGHGKMSKEQFFYGPKGHLRLQVSFNGRRTTYEYEANGHLRLAHYVSGRIERYEYYPNGQLKLIMVHKADGTTRTTRLDENGHRIKPQISGASISN